MINETVSHYLILKKLGGGGMGVVYEAVLARNPKLRVISRTSAFSFKGKEVDAKTIAQKLNVTHLLEGSVRRSGNTVRINANVIRGAAGLASTLGRFDEAVTLAKRSVQLDPLRISAYNEVGLDAYYGGKYDVAEKAFRKILELNPEYSGSHEASGFLYLAQSKPEQALAEMLKEPEPLWRAQGLALAYHALGRKKEADAALAELLKEFPDEAAVMAEVYAYRDEKDKAFESLERAYKARDVGLSNMKGDPLLRHLEHDARYADFLKKMKLPVD